VSQVGCGVLAGFIVTRINGQDSASVSPFKPLSHTLFGLAGGSEDVRWVLDARSKIGNFKRAPIEFPELRLRAGNERGKDDR